MIEQLLEFLVGVIDTQLFEGVQGEDLEPGDIQNANERRALSFASIERFVDARDDPLEHAFVNSLGDRFDSVINLNTDRLSVDVWGRTHLSLCLSFGDEVSSHFQFRFEEGSHEVRDRNAQQMTDLLRHGVVRQGRLIAVSFLLELHVAHLKNGRDRSKDRVQIVGGHVHDLHRFDCMLKFFPIIDAGDGDIAQGQITITTEVFQQIISDHLRVRPAQQLIEDVKGAFFFRLTNGPRFLQQIRFDRGTSDETRGVEVDSNEFTEPRGVIIFHGLGIAER